MSRAPERLERLVLIGFARSPLESVDEVEQMAGRHADPSFTDFVVHWPRTPEPFANVRSILERIAANVLRPTRQKWRYSDSTSGPWVSRLPFFHCPESVACRASA